MNTMLTHPPVLFLADAQGHWRHVDDGWSALTGKPATAALGQGWQAVIHPTDQAKVLAAWAGAIATQQSFQTTYQLALVPGQSVPQSVQHTASLTPEGWVGVIQVLTPVPEPVLALSHSPSGDLLDLIFTQSLDGFFVMLLDEPITWQPDSDDPSFDQEAALDYAFHHQRMVRVNDAMLAQYGSTAEDFLGLTPADMMAHDLAYGKALWRELFNQGRLRIETQEKKADGTPMLIEGDYICLYDDQHRILGHFGAQREITAHKQLESEFEHQKLFLQRILDATPNAVYVYDLAEHRNVYANNRITDLIGYTPDEIAIRGNTLLKDTIHPEDWPCAEANLQRCVTLADGETAEVEYRVRHADGSWRWVQSRDVVFSRDAQGHVQQILGILQDIHDRKQAELALAVSEARLSQLFDNVPAAIYRYIVRPDGTDYFSYLSSSAESIFEVSREDCLADSQQLWDRVHPEDLAAYQVSVQQSADQLKMWQQEFRLQLPSGQVKWMRGQANPSRRANGEIVWDGVLVDETEHKTAKLALKASEARWQFALEGSGDGVWDWNPQTNDVFFSQQYKRMLGYEDAEFANHYDAWAERVHPEDYPMCLAELSKLLTGETEIYQCEHRVRAKDGHYRWILVRGKVLAWTADQQPLRVIGTHTDISERKQTELALQASERRFRHIADHVPGVVLQYLLRTDGSNEILYASAGCLSVWEVEPTAAEEDATLIWDLVHPEDRHGLEESIVASAQNLTPWAWSWRLTTPSGQEKWLEGLGQPQRLPNGDTLWETLILDISDRHRLEEELNDNLARIQELTRNVPALVYRYEVDGAGCEKLSYLSQRAIDIFELPIEECLADINRVWDLVHPEDHAQMQQETWRSRQKLQPWHVTFRLITPSGQQKWIEANARPVRHPDGRTVWDGVMLDVTERKTAELTIQKAQQQFQTLVENSPDIVERFDCDLRHLYVSPSLEKVTGVSADHFIGKTCRELQLESAMVAAFEGAARRVCRTGQAQRIEFVTATTMGRRQFEMLIAPEWHETSGKVESLLCISRDVTAYKQALAAIKVSEMRLQTTIANLPGAVYQCEFNRDYTMRQVSDGILALTGHPASEFVEQQVHLGRLMHMEDREFVWQLIERSVASWSAYEFEYRLVTCTGEVKWLWERGRGVRDERGELLHLEGFITDVTERKLAELALQLQIQQEQALNQITQAMRDSFDLTEIFTTATTQLAGILLLARCAIARFDRGTSPEVEDTWLHVCEYQTDTSRPTMAGTAIPDRDNPVSDLLKRQEMVQFSSRERTDPVHQEVALEFPGTWLLLPLVLGGETWGCLSMSVADLHHTWRRDQVDFAQAVAAQLTIAIRQAQIYGELQQLNQALEVEVQARTAQLRQSLDFGALLQRITEQVRNSLDEQVILQTVVESLGEGLQPVFCNVSTQEEEGREARCMFRQSEVHSAFRPVVDHRGLLLPPAHYPNVYDALRRGEYCHFSTQLTPEAPGLENLTPISGLGEASPRGTSLGETSQPWVTILVVPVSCDGELLGDVLVMRQVEAMFSEAEIHLVTQVASQCAIALRQSRLYETAQGQVEALQRLNTLKDDFLSTVSHELRSPMANIRMATQMLGFNLKKIGALDVTAPYLKILEDEGDREISLIDDLLDLSRLEAGVAQLHPMPVDLRHVLQLVVDPMQGRLEAQHQTLTVAIAPEISWVTTDATYLKRVLTELLHNACKYTPAGEQIDISITCPQALTIQITNTGAAIPSVECDRIFEKFYRVPNNDDPWKHGGTGLGLALVKKMVQALGGEVGATSDQQSTTFTIRLPLVLALDADPISHPRRSR